MFKKRKNIVNFYDDIAGNVRFPIEGVAMQQQQSAVNSVDRELIQMRNSYEARIKTLNAKIRDLQDNMKNANVGDRADLEEQLKKVMSDRDEYNELYKKKEGEVTTLNNAIAKQNKDIDLYKQGELEMEKERIEFKKNMEEAKAKFTIRMDTMAGEINELNQQLQIATIKGGKDSALKAQKDLEDFYKKKLDENTINYQKIIDENKNIKTELSKLNRLSAEKENAYKQLQTNLERATILRMKAEDDLKKLSAEPKDDKDGGRFAAQMKIISELNDEKQKLSTQILILEQENIKLGASAEQAERLQNKAEYSSNTIKLELERIIEEKTILERDINNYQRNAAEIQEKDILIKDLYSRMEEIKNQGQIVVEEITQKNREMENNLMNNQSQLQKSLEERQQMVDQYNQLSAAIHEKDMKLNEVFEQNTRLNENLLRLEEITKLDENEKTKLRNRLILSEGILRSSQQDLIFYKLQLIKDSENETEIAKLEVIKGYVQLIDRQMSLISNIQPLSTHNVSKIEYESNIEEMNQNVKTQTSAIVEEIKAVRDSYIEQQPNQVGFYNMVESSVKELIKDMEVILDKRNNFRYHIQNVRVSYRTSLFKRSDFYKAIESTEHKKITSWFRDLGRKSFKILDFEGKPLEQADYLLNIWRVFGLNIVVLYNDHRRNQAFYGKIAIDNEAVVHEAIVQSKNLEKTRYATFLQLIDDMKTNMNMTIDGDKVVHEIIKRTVLTNIVNDIQATTKNDSLQNVAIKSRKIGEIEEFRFILLPLEWLFSLISPSYLTKFTLQAKNSLDIISPYMCFFLFYNPEMMLISNTTSGFMITLELQRNDYYTVNKKSQLAYQSFPNTSQNIQNTKVSPIKNILKSIEYYSKLFLNSHGGLENSNVTMMFEAHKTYQYDQYFWNLFYSDKSDEFTPSFFNNQVGDATISMNEKIVPDRIKAVSNNPTDLCFYTYSILIGFYLFLLALDTIHISVNSDILFVDLEAYITKSFTQRISTVDMYTINITILEMMKKIVFSSRYVSFFNVYKNEARKRFDNATFNIKYYTKDVWLTHGVVSDPFIQIFSTRPKFEIQSMKTEMNMNLYQKKWDPYMTKGATDSLIHQFMGNIDWSALKNSFPTTVFDAIQLTTGMSFNEKYDADTVDRMQQQMNETLNIDIKKMLTTNPLIQANKIFIRNGVFLESFPNIYFFDNAAAKETQKLLYGVQFLIARIRVLISDTFEMEINDPDALIENLVDDNPEDDENDEVFYEAAANEEEIKEGDDAG